MPGIFKVNDKHVLFANAIAAGQDQWKAYLKFIGSKKTSIPVAKKNGSILANQPPIKKLIEQAREQRNREIMKANLQNQVCEDLQGAVLTVDELDTFHYNVIRGKVLVEEVVPVQTITKDGSGREVSRTTSFMRVKRTPNIRERQASASEIYKRFGHYAPNKLLGAFGKVSDDGDIEDVERFVMLSTGEKIKM